MPTLYMMFGFPGAGKTTAANAINRLTGAAHLSSDTLRLEMFPNPTFSQSEHDALYQELDRQTEELLKAGKDVIYDANLNRRKHRDDKYVICKNAHAGSILVWVRTSRKTSEERAIDVIRKPLWPKNETASEMFNRVADIIELPEPDEPALKIDGTRITDDYIAKKLGL